MSVNINHNKYIRKLNKCVIYSFKLHIFDHKFCILDVTSNWLQYPGVSLRWFLIITFKIQYVPWIHIKMWESVFFLQSISSAIYYVYNHLNLLSVSLSSRQATGVLAVSWSRWQKVNFLFICLCWSVDFFYFNIKRIHTYNL